MSASEKLHSPSRKILFICGSLNQTTMMHEISKHLECHDCYFTPYYADGFIDALARQGFLDFSILGGSFRRTTEKYLEEHKLPIDFQGNSHNYDLVFTGSDLIVPKNIKNKKLILVQEGMTDPKNLGYYMVKWLKLPRYIASTSTTGLSNAFDVFCVASRGYKDLFVSNGINAGKIRVTGIPNYDNCIKYCDNDFPYKNFVLAATSDARETFKYENRKKFIEKSLEIANGRRLIFKLHPNEDFDRATREINRWAPEAIVYTSGNIHEMIANCDVLITKYSTVVYTGIALGKKVYSFFNLNSLKRLAPLQNGGASAENIAAIGESLMMKKSFGKNGSRKLKNTFLLLSKKNRKSQGILQ
jgi:hypothetical protein